MIFIEWAVPYPKYFVEHFYKLGLKIVGHKDGDILWECGRSFFITTISKPEFVDEYGPGICGFGLKKPIYAGQTNSFSKYTNYYLDDELISKLKNYFNYEFQTPISGFQGIRLAHFTPEYEIDYVTIQVSQIDAVVRNLKKRGIKFLKFEKSRYDLMNETLPKSRLYTRHLQELNIIMDYTEKDGLVQQSFTKPSSEFPVFKIVQRHFMDDTEKKLRLGI